MIKKDPNLMNIDFRDERKGHQMTTYNCNDITCSLFLSNYGKVLTYS
jgi:hypothetical protein